MHASTEDVYVVDGQYDTCFPRFEPNSDAIRALALDCRQFRGSRCRPRQPPSLHLSAGGAQQLPIAGIPRVHPCQEASSSQSQGRAPSLPLPCTQTGLIQHHAHGVTTNSCPKRHGRIQTETQINNREEVFELNVSNVALLSCSPSPKAHSLQ
jgi:hypothetical protein